MEYRVEELAADRGLGRRHRPLLSEPASAAGARRGAAAWSGTTRATRSPAPDPRSQTPAPDPRQIRRVVERPEQQPLLTALVEESRGGQLFTRARLRGAAVPEALIRRRRGGGLARTTVIDGEPQFSEAESDGARRPAHPRGPASDARAARRRELHRDQSSRSASARSTSSTRTCAARRRRFRSASDRRSLPHAAAAADDPRRTALPTHSGDARDERLSRPAEREALAAAVAATESARLDVVWR